MKQKFIWVERIFFKKKNRRLVENLLDALLMKSVSSTCISEFLAIVTTRLELPNPKIPKRFILVGYFFIFAPSHLTGANLTN